MAETCFIASPPAVAAGGVCAPTTPNPGFAVAPLHFWSAWDVDGPAATTLNDSGTGAAPFTQTSGTTLISASPAAGGGHCQIEVTGVLGAETTYSDGPNLQHNTLSIIFLATITAGVEVIAGQWESAASADQLWYIASESPRRIRFFFNQNGTGGGTKRSIVEGNGSYNFDTDRVLRAIHATPTHVRMWDASGTQVATTNRDYGHDGLTVPVNLFNSDNPTSSGMVTGSGIELFGIWPDGLSEAQLLTELATINAWASDGINNPV